LREIIGAYCRANREVWRFRCQIHGRRRARIFRLSAGG
jgi:hypothetical protein